MQKCFRNVPRKNILYIFPNLYFRYDDVLQTVNDAFHHIDGDRWRRACEHVEKHVAECIRDDHAVDQHIDAIVINLADTSESESSDDDDL